MEPISSEIVEKTWKRIGGMSPLKAPKLISLMQKQQPFVLAYVMGVGGNTLNQDERELLLYLGIVVWQIMLHRFIFFQLWNSYRNVVVKNT